MESYTYFDELNEKIEELQAKIKELKEILTEEREEREEEQAQLKACQNLIDELEHNNIISSYDLDIYFKFA